MGRAERRRRSEERERESISKSKSKRKRKRAKARARARARASARASARARARASASARASERARDAYPLICFDRRNTRRRACAHRDVCPFANARQRTHTYLFALPIPSHTLVLAHMHTDACAYVHTRVRVRPAKCILYTRGECTASSSPRSHVRWLQQNQVEEVVPAALNSDGLSQSPFDLCGWRSNHLPPEGGPLAWSTAQVRRPRKTLLPRCTCALLCPPGLYRSALSSTRIPLTTRPPQTSLASMFALLFMLRSWPLSLRRADATFIETPFV